MSRIVKRLANKIVETGVSAQHELAAKAGFLRDSRTWKKIAIPITGLGIAFSSLIGSFYTKGLPGEQYLSFGPKLTEPIALRVLGEEPVDSTGTDTPQQAGMKGLPTISFFSSNRTVQDFQNQPYLKNADALLYVDGSPSYRFVPQSEIPALVKNSIVELEDRRFWRRTSGVDPISIFGAIAYNLSHLEMTARGAGTIPMQNARGLLVGSYDQSFSRKFSETRHAIHMHHQLSKDEILLQYINNLGVSGGKGLEASLQYNFSKSVDEATIPELLKVVTEFYSPKYMDHFREAERLGIDLSKTSLDDLPVDFLPKKRFDHVINFLHEKGIIDSLYSYNDLVFNKGSAEKLDPYLVNSALLQFNSVSKTMGLDKDRPYLVQTTADNFTSSRIKAKLDSIQYDLDANFSLVSLPFRNTLDSLEAIVDDAEVSDSTLRSFIDDLEKGMELSDSRMQSRFGEQTDSLQAVLRDSVIVSDRVRELVGSLQEGVDSINELQFAMMVVSPQGEVLIERGGNYSVENQYNLYDGNVSPGSLYKIIYGAQLFEDLRRPFSEISTNAYLPDSKLRAIRAQSKHIDNHDNTKFVSLSLEEAMYKSYNRNVVWSLQEATDSTVASYLKDKTVPFFQRLGLAQNADTAALDYHRDPFDNNDLRPQFITGSALHGENPAALVRAFLTFRNGGHMHDLTRLVRVIENGSDILYTYENMPRQVLDEEVTDYTYSLMNGVLNYAGRGFINSVPELSDLIAEGGSKTGTGNKAAHFMYLSSNDPSQEHALYTAGGKRIGAIHFMVAGDNRSSEDGESNRVSSTQVVKYASEIMPLLVRRNN